MHSLPEGLQLCWQPILASSGTPTGQWELSSAVRGPMQLLQDVGAAALPWAAGYKAPRIKPTLQIPLVSLPVWQDSQTHNRDWRWYPVTTMHSFVIFFMEHGAACDLGSCFKEWLGWSYILAHFRLPYQCKRNPLACRTTEGTLVLNSGSPFPGGGSVACPIRRENLSPWQPSWRI